MLTIDEAFRKLKSRLELNTKEQQNATARHTQVREFVASKFQIDQDFLTGSYARDTKTKPLKDIDIFFVLGVSHAHYKKESPSKVLDDFHRELKREYGDTAVRKQSRSINIDFGIVADAEDNTDYRVLSIDVVPAFADGTNYLIPDTETGKWIKTNPEIHAQRATDANKAYSGEWKGMVRMLKYWNNNPRHGEKPVKPSFLIEVMALQCLHGGWHGRFDYEMQSAFETLANRIADNWADPAGLGPSVSNAMDASKRSRAQALLSKAAREATLAIDLARKGRNGEALRAWREMFGPKFPLS